MWTTQRIQILCDEELNIHMSRMSIWRYLKDVGHSCKRVQKIYNEADQNAQDKWATQTIREIKRTVKKHRAILYFEDESNISLSPNVGTSWSPIGERITEKVTGKRGSISAISAISNDRRLLFSLHDSGKRFNSGDIINFLNQMLSHHPRRHLIVVMDQAPCHTSKKVKEYVGSKKRLHVFYLPSYSPEFNPDEKVWNHLKNIELKDHQEKEVKGLKKLVRSKLRKISKSPNTVNAIFKRCDYSDLYEV